MTMIDFTNITQPVYKVFGNDTISFNGISTYNSNRVSRFIDSGTALYYFISNNQENYDRQYQITLLKLSYDMEYLDTCRTQEFSFVVTQDNTSYVYTEIASLNFVCKISNSEYFPETYPSSSFNFSQSPHVIFPRYYIRGDLNSCRGPQAVILPQNQNLTILLTSNNTLPIELIVCEQCQKVPINQTMIISVNPDYNQNFINFLPDGKLIIEISEVFQVDLFTISIANQLSLLNPDIKSYSQFEYLWDNSIEFQIELKNSIPQLNLNKNKFEAYLNSEFSLNLNFHDQENDIVYFRFSSQSSTIVDTSNFTACGLNNYTITWTPTSFDIGISMVTINYYDQYHSRVPETALIEINVANYTMLVFESNLADQSIFAGQKTQIELPKIINPSNVQINLSVSNTNKNYQFVETSDWLNYTKDFIQFFPKCEILGEFSDIIYYVNVSLTTSSFTLFKLTIQNNTINSICGQNDILFTAGLLKSINLTSRVMINDIVSLNLIAVQGISFYNNFFHLSNILSISQTTNRNLNSSEVYLSIIDTKKVMYQSNLFNLTVVKNYPPTVVYQPGLIIFYYGNLINKIIFPENPFMDDDIMTYYINECYIENSLFVSFTNLFEFNNSLKSINIYFASSFTGRCIYEIIAQDILNQTASLTFNIQVIGCSQTDCIKCSGPLQIDCELCLDGYALNSESGTCYLIENINYFTESKYLFITCLLILNIILSIIALIIEHNSEMLSVVIYSNQICLFALLMRNQLSANLINFLSVLQWTKLDFKVLDVILNLRHIVDSKFYDAQFTDLRSLNFSSGSTFANYINLIVLFAIVEFFILLFVFVRRTNPRDEIQIFIVYLNKIIDPSIFISVLRLGSGFILLNCFSELFNQIAFGLDGGDILSYIFADLLIILMLWILLFHKKLNEGSILPKAKFLFKHERLNLVKMALIALCFLFKDSCRACRWGIAVIQLAYLVFIIVCCGEIKIEKVAFICVNTILFLCTLIPAIPCSSYIQDQLSILSVTMLNCLLFLFLIYLFAIKIALWFRNSFKGKQKNN